MAAVKQRGYGVVTPTKEEIVLEEPQIVKHGSKYGVKIKASAPSIHMIRANISTEIAPIVGEEYQAKDLMDYIEQGSNQPGESMWDVNIFGKTLEQWHIRQTGNIMFGIHLWYILWEFYVMGFQSCSFNGMR